MEEIKKALKYAELQDLKPFLRDYMGVKGAYKLSKEEAMEIADQLLNETTFPIYQEHLRCYGVTAQEAADMMGMRLCKIKKYLGKRIRLSGQQYNRCTGKRNRKRNIYRLDDVLHFEFTEEEIKMQQELDAIELNDENLAAALYTINKAAKKARDKQTRKGALRKTQLYNFKNKVMRKALEEGRMTFMGYQYQVHDDGTRVPLKAYEWGNHKFHSLTDEESVDKNNLLENIVGEISAKKYRNCMPYRQAEYILEKYVGDTAFGYRDEIVSEWIGRPVFLTWKEEHMPPIDDWSSYDEPWYTDTDRAEEYSWDNDEEDDDDYFWSGEDRYYA